MSAATWNRNPAVFQARAQPVLTTKEAVKAIARLLAIAVTAAFSARYSSVLLLGLAPARLKVLLDMLLWGVTFVAGTRAVNTGYQWKASRGAQAAQETMAAPQRKLLGLPPATPKPQPSEQRKPLMPTPGPQPMTPISPPQRVLRTPYSASMGGEVLGTVGRVGGGLAEPFTPYTGSTGISRPSPGSRSMGVAVATPEQLQAYLDSVAAAETPAAGLSPATADFSAYGFGGGFGAGGYPLTPSAQDVQDGVPSPAMPIGVELPKYRPSWLPRAKAAAHQAAPDALSASTDEEVEEFLWGVLKARREWLEVWTERLREWFAGRVLQPLVAAVDSAHADANKILTKYGQLTRLPPLPALVSATGGGADAEAVLRHAQQWCSALAAQSGMNAAYAADARALANALIRYEQLALLLRGRRPTDLLPPAPQGYVWARVQELAEGTCMPAFNWNGGGAWAGRAWSPDLPNDSLLVLYLFAAFLDAPGWEFGAGMGPGGSSGAAGAGDDLGRGMPLFLGSLRSRPPQRYSAILTFRPDKPGPGIDALLALPGGGAAAGHHHAGAGPAGGAGGIVSAAGGSLFCFLAEGRLLVFTGYNALFHGIIAFLLFHKHKLNGAVGLHYLQDASLGLSSVIQPPAVGAGATARHSVFGWWFPPAPAHAKDD